MQLREGVIGEEIDGEVVVIDLASGVYYSLRGGAVAVWQLLRAGTSRAVILATLSGRYDVTSEVLAPAVDALLDALLKDAVIVDSAPAESADVPAQPSGSRVPFEPFEFERFDDMAHVIQLDPVHDVDPDRGWPLQVD